MIGEWVEPVSQDEFMKKVSELCENVEPKVWPYTKRSQGSFLIPLMEDPVHIGIVVQKPRGSVPTSIYLPGGDECTPSPKTTVLEQASRMMGIESRKIRLLGYLGFYPLRDVEYDAHIYLAWTPPMEEWNLDPDQIERAYKIPLEYFLEEFKSPFFDLKNPEFSFSTSEEEEAEECVLSDVSARIVSMLVRRFCVY